MIQFENLHKSFPSGGGERKVIVRHLSLVLPSGQSLALLGRNGAGKSTFLQMIAGNIRPDRGKIVSNGTISWPVGLAGAVHRDMTGAQNIRFIARIYEVDTEQLCAFVADFSELGQHFYLPVRSYSSGMRSRLIFGAAMGIHFDTYLIDEVTAVGDARFKRKSRAVFRERIKNASAIMVSHQMEQVRQFCNAGLVLEKGELYYYSDLEEAIEVHQYLMGHA